MTPQTAETAHRPPADAVIPLPPRHLACPVCGVFALPIPESQLVVVEAMAREGEPPPPPGSSRSTQLRTTTFARCADCDVRRASARVLLAAHPRVSAQLGHDVALYRTECALAALAAVDQQPPSQPSETVFASLLRNLALPGALACWQSRFAPVLAKGADPTTCNPYPWAHLPNDLREQVLAGVALLLAERAAVSAAPVRLPPPADRLPGCLLCGVGHVAVVAARVVRLGGRQAAQRDVWQPLTATPTSLGGQPSPERVAGYACPQCHDAIAGVGAVGETAMERALVAYLRSAGREDEATRIRQADDVRLVGWAALADAAKRRRVAMPSPNDQAWAHLAI